MAGLEPRGLPDQLEAPERPGPLATLVQQGKVERLAPRVLLVPLALLEEAVQVV